MGGEEKGRDGMGWEWRAGQGRGGERERERGESGLFITVVLAHDYLPMSVGNVLT